MRTCRGEPSVHTADIAINTIAGRALALPPVAA